VLEKGVLRRIFGPKRDEMTGRRRKLHNEERVVYVVVTLWYKPEGRGFDFR
jgi:hypothetical protein